MCGPAFRRGPRPGPLGGAGEVSLRGEARVKGRLPFQSGRKPKAGVNLRPRVGREAGGQRPGSAVGTLAFGARTFSPRAGTVNLKHI
jgi:hypothetical protein